MHLYRNSANVYPVPVTVVASVKKTIEDSAQQIVATEVELGQEGVEITAFRFRLDADGNLVPGSVHSLMRPLRSAKS